MDSTGSCINCAYFHHGLCRYSPRVCYSCNKCGHISRYCPDRQRRRRGLNGQILPGSAEWFHVLGLDHDRQLMDRIRSTLTSKPGATIFLNDECIYRGVQEFFYREELPRGTELSERIKGLYTQRGFRTGVELRARSPSKERQFKRERDPLEASTPVGQRKVEEYTIGKAGRFGGWKEATSVLVRGNETRCLEANESKKVLHAPVVQTILSQQVSLVRPKEEKIGQHFEVEGSHAKPIVIDDDGPQLGGSRATAIKIFDLDVSSVPNLKIGLATRTE